MLQVLRVSLGREDERTCLRQLPRIDARVLRLRLLRLLLGFGRVRNNLRIRIELRPESEGEPILLLRRGAAGRTGGGGQHGFLVS